MNSIETNVLDIFEGLFNIGEFYHKGLFSKKVSLNYEAVSNQPWVGFNCKENNKYSFRIHDLEIGEKELIYWHGSAQKNKEIKFNGFENIFSYFGDAKLRGILSIPEDNQRLGIYMEKGRINKLKTQEQLYGDETNALVMFFSLIENHDKKEKLKCQK